MMGSSGRLIVAILLVAALAIGFWTLVLGPKRDKADELGTQVEQLTAAVETARSEVVQATAAQRSFPTDYRQLVVLGQAAPQGDETASLLVELEQLATAAGVKFKNIQLESSGEAAPAPAIAPTEAPAASGAAGGAVPAAATVPATEIAASLLPLGASIGPAGLDVMPYTLDFSGDFFQVAKFIGKIDSLVEPGGSRVAVNGRLVTVDGFALSADSERGFPHLDANFTVTTYVTPPGQGITAGATPTAPAPSTAAPVSGEAAPAGETSTPSSETVSAR